MQDAEAGNGREEQDGAAGAGGDHVASACLGDEEGTGEVDIEELAEHGGVVGFGFDIGAVVGEWEKKDLMSTGNIIIVGEPYGASRTGQLTREEGRERQNEKISTSVRQIARLLACSLACLLACLLEVLTPRSQPN